MKHTRKAIFTTLALLFVSTFAFGQNSVSTAKVEADRGKDGAVRTPAKPVTVPMIQSDLREALSVIELNYGGRERSTTTRSSNLRSTRCFTRSTRTRIISMQRNSSSFDGPEPRYFGIGNDRRPQRRIGQCDRHLHQGDL